MSCSTTRSTPSRTWPWPIIRCSPCCTRRPPWIGPSKSWARPVGAPAPGTCTRQYRSSPLGTGAGSCPMCTAFPTASSWRPGPPNSPTRPSPTWPSGQPGSPRRRAFPLAIAATRAAGLRLEFSGPIADRRHFSDEVEPLLGADVRYVGHLTHAELPDFFARGSVFVSSPTWAEPFGLAMVEAMACGTPVAALARGAAAEVVSSEGGVLARANTVEGLASGHQASRPAGPSRRTAHRPAVRQVDHARPVRNHAVRVGGRPWDAGRASSAGRRAPAS